MTTSPMVDVRDVTRHYGPVRAVDGVSLTVQRGIIFGLLGHNGAGKSTLLRMLLGLESPTAGKVFIDGVAVDGRDAREMRRQIGYVPEQVVLYDNLTGLETLRFFAALKGVPVTACAPALERLGLGGAGRRRVAEYSKGMKQRLCLAQAILGHPRLLFFDEPTTALDPEAVRAFYTLLAELRADGVTIVLSSHSLAEIQDRVDELAIMVSGRVRVTGSVQALRDQVALPLRIRMTVRPDADTAVADLVASQPVTVVERSGNLVRLSCPRAAKLAVVAGLSTRSDLVLDLEVLEPSLEDVFFGVGE